MEELTLTRGLKGGWSSSGVTVKNMDELRQKEFTG